MKKLTPAQIAECRKTRLTASIRRHMVAAIVHDATAEWRNKLRRSQYSLATRTYNKILGHHRQKVQQAPKEWFEHNTQVVAELVSSRKQPYGEPVAVHLRYAKPMPHHLMKSRSRILRTTKLGQELAKARLEQMEFETYRRMQSMKIREAIYAVRSGKDLVEAWPEALPYLWAAIEALRPYATRPHRMPPRNAPGQKSCRDMLANLRSGLKLG